LGILESDSVIKEVLCFDQKKTRRHLVLAAGFPKTLVVLLRLLVLNDHNPTHAASLPMMIGMMLNVMVMNSVTDHNW
jgi:hypothetical protein